MASQQFNFKFLLASIGLSLAGLGMVVYLTADERTLEGLLGFSPPFLAVTASLVITMWTLDGLRVRSMLRMMEEDLNLKDAMRINLASSFIAGITPFTSGGPPTQVYLLYRIGIPLNKAMAVVASRTLLTFLYFGTLVPVILLAFRRYLSLSPNLNLLVSLALVGVFLGIAAFLYICLRPDIVEVASRWLVSTRLASVLLRSRDRSATTNRAASEARKFSHSLRLVFGSGNLLGITSLVLYTFAQWTIFFSLAPILLIGLGLDIPVLEVLTRQVVLFFIVSYLPIPGGSGVAEIGFASAFARLLPAHLLPVFVGGWRFLTYHLTLLAGSISLATSGRR